MGIRRPTAMTMGMELQRAEAQAETALRDIMAGSDYFYCEKYRCRMPIAACLARQKQTANFFEGSPAGDPGCRDCPQGRKNLTAHPAAGRPRPRRDKKEKIAMNKNSTDAAATATAPKTKPSGSNRSVTGKCKNCLRNGVKIMDQMQLCFQCLDYARGTKGELRIQRLSEAAKLYGPLKPGERLPYGAAAAKKSGKPFYRAAARDINKSEHKEGIKPSSVIPASPSVIPASPSVIPAKAGIQPPQKLAAAPAGEGALITLVFPAADLPLYERIIATASHYRRTPDQQILWMVAVALDLAERTAKRED